MKYKLLFLLLLAQSECALADQESDFRAARDAFRIGNIARLDAAAARLKDSPLEPYVSYYQLRMRWSDKNSAPIKAFLARSDESPVIDQFRGEWLKYLGKQERWAEFEQEYPHLVKGDDELTCYALQMRRRSDEAGALAEARKLWFSGEEMPESCVPLFAAALKQGVIAEADIWQRMRMALERGNTSLAKKFIKDLPKAQQFPAAELGSAASNPRRYLEKTKFDKAGMGRRTAALFALQRLARQSPEMAYARWEIIGKNFGEEEQRYFFSWLGFAGALAHDERALGWFAVAGDEALTPKQRAWRARAALRAGDWHEVWESVNAMQPQQQSEGAWRYWKGRALKALGRTADAEELFAKLGSEYNFYGQLAAEELGGAPGAGMISASFQASDAEIEAVQAQPAIQRTLLLYEMDFRAEAAKEWAWATRNFSDRQLLVAAEVAKRNRMYDRSINAADRTVSLHDFNLRYPAPYREAMQTDLQKNSLEEAWVYGLMRQESRFTVGAKSDVGAAGIMQIMPSTARWAAKRMGMKGYRKGLIHQLDVNITLGTYYMKTVYSQFNENPVLASAAYNAGPGRARQWRGTKPLEGAIYVETIPFDETRDYVKKVMSNTIYYSKLFGQTSQSLKQRMGTIEAKKQATADEQ
ncbi:MAG: transglycosylase SLT domain-containing protein [Sideroxydans sp.]|nr:transglycosylase SLT domain-containing protein [Sideroxydans sp.]